MDCYSFVSFGEELCFAKRYNLLIMTLNRLFRSTRRDHLLTRVRPCLFNVPRDYRAHACMKGDHWEQVMERTE